MSEGTN